MDETVVNIDGRVCSLTPGPQASEERAEIDRTIEFLNNKKSKLIQRKKTDGELVGNLYDHFSFALDYLGTPISRKAIRIESKTIAVDIKFNHMAIMFKNQLVAVFDRSKTPYQFAVERGPWIEIVRLLATTMSANAQLQRQINQKEKIEASIAMMQEQEEKLLAQTKEEISSQIQDPLDGQL